MKLKEVPSEKKKSGAKISLDTNILQAKESSKNTATTSSVNNNTTNNSTNKAQISENFSSNNNILLDFDIKESNLKFYF